MIWQLRLRVMYLVVLDSKHLLVYLEMISELHIILHVNVVM
jgi:hypothetical protein